MKGPDGTTYHCEICMVHHIRPGTIPVLAALATCLSLAGIQVASELNRPSLPISAQVYPVGDLVKDQERNLSIVVRNDSRRPVRLIGARETCGPEGCARVEDLPATLPPRGELCVSIHFQAGLEGDFIKEIPVYTDHPEQSSFILRISGRVLRSD